MSSGPVVVQPVANGRDLNEFIALPKRLYRGQKGYIAPLDLERKETLSRKKNPYFQHAEGELFLARRGGEVVGRISAQFCRLHQEKYRNDVGHFGWLDTIDDVNVMRALAGAGGELAEGARRQAHPRPLQLLLQRGNRPADRRLRRAPMLMMPYHLPYQGKLIEACGFAKAKDMVAYTVDKATYHAVGSNRMLDKAASDGRIRLRPLDMKNYKPDLSALLAGVQRRLVGELGDGAVRAAGDRGRRRQP